MGQCLSFFAWMQQDPWSLQLAGVDNSNELHNKINEHKSIVADMLSDWKGYGPICFQIGRDMGRYGFRLEGIWAPYP